MKVHTLTYLSPVFVGDIAKFTNSIATSRDILGTFTTIASLIRLNQFLFTFDHALNASDELEAIGWKFLSKEKT